MKLRTKIVTPGWEGSDTLAIEFTPELAKLGLTLCAKALAQEKFNMVKNDTFEVCADVIKNAENGEVTYILDWQYQRYLEEIEKLNQLLK